MGKIFHAYSGNEIRDFGINHKSPRGTNSLVNGFNYAIHHWGRGWL